MTKSFARRAVVCVCVFVVAASIDFSFIHFEPFDGISKITEWGSAAVSERTENYKMKDTNVTE